LIITLILTDDLYLLTQYYTPTVKKVISLPEPASSKPKKLLDQLRDAIRIKHYSYSTEKTYVHWAKRYILFYKAKQGFARHPAEMGSPEIEAFLTYLAQKANVSASTQNQAFNALFFSVSKCSADLVGCSYSCPAR